MARLHSSTWCCWSAGFQLITIISGDRLFVGWFMAILLDFVTKPPPNNPDWRQNSPSLLPPLTQKQRSEENTVSAVLMVLKLTGNIPCRGQSVILDFYVTRDSFKHDLLAPCCSGAARSSKLLIHAATKVSSELWLFVWNKLRMPGARQSVICSIR